MPPKIRIKTTQSGSQQLFCLIQVSFFFFFWFVIANANSFFFLLLIFLIEFKRPHRIDDLKEIDVKKTLSDMLAKKKRRQRKCLAFHFFFCA